MDYKELVLRWPWLLLSFAKNTICYAIFVVVDVWGVPSQVLLLESSGSNGADESAMRFARSLRWVPSREPRSGTMSIEWKEEEP